ncbi:MAG: ABC transporter substrate-binding protein [Bifidobacteriaceae bacterium]|nr:ABC transporter substrate-binding protein [Bifidobacteriaceae bacterium]MCI1978925.1 ABC transporter substrate-binding protein [Bifidobacteriaceae bacterium]
MNPVRRLRLSAIVAVLLGASMALSGCGTSAAPTSSTADGTADSTAVITANNTEPGAGLIPGSTADTAGWKVVTLLFDGLVTFSNTGDLVMADAKSITPSKDASVYTITLKPNLQFSNGEKITASTYAKAWSFSANAANGQTGAAIFSTIKGYDDLQDKNSDKDAQLSGLKVINDTTLQVTLAAPDSSFAYKVGDVAFMPLPSVAYKDITAFGRNPIGNGPYTFESWTHNEEIKLKANSKYAGPRKPANGGITFKIYSDLDAAYADAEAGNLDLLDQVPTSALSTYKNDPDIKAIDKVGPGFKSLTIPQSLKHFSGEEGRLRRKAISMAINRDQLTRKILLGSATPATDFTAPQIAGYSDTLDSDKVLVYNATEAKKLWEQANEISAWSGDFEISYAGDTTDKDWVDAVANSLKNALGINAKSVPFPTSKELSTAILNRTVGTAFKSGMQSDYPHPEGYLVQAYGSDFADGKGLNNGDYKSDEFDSLISQAATQTDLSEAEKTYQKAEKVLLKDLPVIPLWYANVNAATSKEVSNVEINYMGFPQYYKVTK